MTTLTPTRIEPGRAGATATDPAARSTDTDRPGQVLLVPPEDPSWP